MYNRKRQPCILCKRESCILFMCSPSNFLDLLCLYCWKQLLNCQNMQEEMGHSLEEIDAVYMLSDMGYGLPTG